MKTFITDIKDGQRLQDQFMVKQLQVAETKAGKPYLNLKLMDKSGEIIGRVWDKAEYWQQECPEGQVVTVNATVQSYRGTLQLNISEIRAVQGDIDFGDFVPTSKYNIEEMATEFMGLVRAVKEPMIRKLLLKFFNNDEFMAIFKRAPAAKAMHHAYLGGLLEHTLGLARLADSVSNIYPNIDKSLLMAGAMLHDIGKVKEFSFDSHTFDYSDQGRLMGHMVIGVEMIQERIAKIKDFPEDLAVRIKHLILSHHGRYEFGSPTLPALLEGFVLNFIDDMDAKINTIEKVTNLAKEEGYQWSDYQRSLERFLFVKGQPAQQDQSIDSLQDQTTPIIPPTLF